jgi:sphingosine kinase
VIAVASGDGGYYEVFNGLAGRDDAVKALRTPIAPLPTGSACAACTNLFGPKDTFNVPLATLNAIKGQPMAIDLQSVVLLPSQERRVSFLSVALGLMVDLDIGTENLRWMGDSRFIYGYLRGVMQSKSCKALIKLDVVEADKEKMAREAREAALAERGPRTVGGGTDPLQLIRGVQSMSVNSKAVANGNGYGDGHTPSSSRKASGSSASSSAPGEGSSAVPAGPATEATESATPAATNGTNTEGGLPPVDLLQPSDSWMTVNSSTPGRRGSKSAAPNTFGEGDSLLFF